MAGSPGTPHPGSIGPRLIAIVAAVVVLLALAAAGGSLIRGTSSRATARQAFPYALIGAAAALAIGAIVLVAWRAARGRLPTLGRADWMAAGLVLAVLGALVGATLTPDTPNVADVSPLDDEEIEQREGQSRQFGEGTVAGTVDRDGDGRADLDRDGNLIIAFDIDGDGRVDGYLQPCPPGTTIDERRPGYTPIDNDCDGQVDDWLRFDPNRVLETELAFPDQPPSTISPSARQERAEGQGASGKIGSTLRAVLLLLAVVAIAAAIITAIVRMPDREKQDDDHGDAEPDQPPVPDLAPSLAASLDAMLDDPDPRRAICAAYGRLLEGLAEIGLPRRPEEAPAEHIARCLDSARLDRQATSQLLGLFAVARFSHHPVGEGHRAAAIDAMRRVLESTAHDPEAPPPLVGAGRTDGS